MDTLDDLTGVILAGGLGTRLRSAVSDRPKILAEVDGRPFVTFLLDQLAAAGLGEAVLCVGYRSEQVRTALGSAYRGIRLVYSEEPRPLGTAGALRFALPHIASSALLAMNGDSYCQADLHALLRRHTETSANATVLLTEVEDTGRYGRVTIDADGCILGFTEKNVTAGPGWINAGVYVLRRSLVSALPPERPLSLERDVFPTCVGNRFYGFAGGKEFLDIGTPESYARAEWFFARRGGE